ncbi:MAG: tRNA lysidine(34) synthetase TilS [Synechococcaceae cyanobacterium]|nr:tRNA lysidine(34) synthetase TilS [Synechococcaceae cyanobacterium]
MEILPPEVTAVRRPWDGDQLRLHRWLRQRPGLLPPGARLLLAVSGGQDSMAMTALLRDLQPLYGWELRLWHGDHGWRPEAMAQAWALGAWAARQGLDCVQDRAEPGHVPSEAAARRWRYACLERQAQALGCSHVLTGHTASDRAETVLLNLARGCHLQGLASLRECRPLLPSEAASPSLVRPLLLFDRADTARICRQRQLPVWVDASNDDLRLARNRIRAELLPLLEQLHPGAGRRISQQAARLADQLDHQHALQDLALTALSRTVPPPDQALDQRALAALPAATRRDLLQRWLQRWTGRSPSAAVLDGLCRRLGQGGGRGRHDLGAGWRLHWAASTLNLSPLASPHGGLGRDDPD